MIKIVRGRDTGKTRELILAASEVGGTIVCRSPQSMYDKMYALNVANVEVLSFKEFLAISDRQQRKFFFDNPDMFIANICELVGGELSGLDMIIE